MRRASATRLRRAETELCNSQLSSKNHQLISPSVVAPSAPSFFKQEPAHFSNDQRFVYYEHVVVSVMQFDDSRVLHARAEAPDCAFYPVRERLDVAIEFLLRGRDPAYSRGRQRTLSGTFTMICISLSSRMASSVDSKPVCRQAIRPARL